MYFMCEAVFFMYSCILHTCTSHVYFMYSSCVIDLERQYMNVSANRSLVARYVSLCDFFLRNNVSLFTCVCVCVCRVTITFGVWFMCMLICPCVCVISVTFHLKKHVSRWVCIMSLCAPSAACLRVFFGFIYHRVAFIHCEERRSCSVDQL
jgi:hypothetical protein